MSITITKLDHPEHYGDWHDKPLKRIVSGPAAETQKFSTKSEASNYASRRRRSSTQLEAINAFVQS